MSKHTSTDIATRYLQDDEALASVNNRRIHALAKEIDQYTKEQNAEMLEALKEIRNNPKLWKTRGIGGQDQYAGLPPFCRLIDSLLAKAEGGNP